MTDFLLTIEGLRVVILILAVIHYRWQTDPPFVSQIGREVTRLAFPI